MKLYIATIINIHEYGTCADTFVGTSADGVASQVCKFLGEDGIPYDSDDVLVECQTGNQHDGNEPLCIGTDTDLHRQFFISTKIAEV